MSFTGGSAGSALEYRRTGLPDAVEDLERRPGPAPADFSQ